MADEAFLRFCRELDAQGYRILEQAQHEYAEAQNRFSNFERAAAALQRNARLRAVTRVDVACVYFAKHVDAIIAGVSLREDMQGRIVDAMNYLRLIAAMLQADAQSAPAQPPLRDTVRRYTWGWVPEAVLPVNRLTHCYDAQTHQLLCGARLVQFEPVLDTATVRESASCPQCWASSRHVPITAVGAIADAASGAEPVYTERDGAIWGLASSLNDGLIHNWGGGNLTSVCGKRRLVDITQDADAADRGQVCEACQREEG